MKWRFSNGHSEGEKPFREEPYDSLMEARSDSHMLEWQDGKKKGSTYCTPLLENFIEECAQHIRSKGDPMYNNWVDMAITNGSSITSARMCSQCLQEVDREIGPFMKAVLKQLCKDARGSID